jgi:hypothetical protein
VIRTVGHSTLTAEDFAALLVVADIGLLVDLRRYPGSRERSAKTQARLCTTAPRCEAARRSADFRAFA